MFSGYPSAYLSLVIVWYLNGTPPDPSLIIQPCLLIQGWYFGLQGSKPTRINQFQRFTKVGTRVTEQNKRWINSEGLCSSNSAVPEKSCKWIYAPGNNRETWCRQWQSVMPIPIYQCSWYLGIGYKIEKNDRDHSHNLWNLPMAPPRRWSIPRYSPIVLPWCIHICMYVCMYACMHVCTCVWNVNVYVYILIYYHQFIRMKSDSFHTRCSGKWSSTLNNNQDPILR